MKKRELIKRLKIFILSIVVMSGAVSAPSFPVLAGAMETPAVMRRRHLRSRNLNRSPNLSPNLSPSRNPSRSRSPIPNPSRTAETRQETTERIREPEEPVIPRRQMTAGKMTAGTELPETEALPSMRKAARNRLRTQGPQERRHPRETQE